MSGFCPWNRELSKWDGVCSHCSLFKAVRGDHDLTAEELLSIDEEFRTRRAAAQNVSSCRHAQNAQANDIDAFRAKNRR